LSQHDYSIVIFFHDSIILFSMLLAACSVVYNIIWHGMIFLYTVLYYITFLLYIILHYITGDFN